MVDVPKLGVVVPGWLTPPLEVETLLPGDRLVASALAVVVANALLVVSTLLVVDACVAPDIMFTVTGTIASCPRCCLFKNGKRRWVCLPLRGMGFTFLPTFVRATRGALRRSILCGSGEGFPW
jgi:hypothetical protein